jgi:hypothetical protein
MDEERIHLRDAELAGFSNFIGKAQLCCLCGPLHSALNIPKLQGREKINHKERNNTKKM